MIEESNTYTLKPTFHSRQNEELLIMLHFIQNSEEKIREFCSNHEGGEAPPQEELLSMLNICLEEKDTSNPEPLAREIKTLLSCYNYYYRLKKENLRELAKLRRGGLLPTATPSEYIDENLWWIKGKEWIGHGYYWKFSENENLEKDLGAMDFDTIEGGYIRLGKAQVLVADYPLLKHLFPQILKEMGNKEINSWLLNQTAYLSQGQVARITEGDLSAYIDIPEGCFCYEDIKGGVRQKGGGRTTSFFIDNKYSFGDGGILIEMIDVKGVGTTNMQKEFDSKANGFLPLTDALKELGYQRLIERVCNIGDIEWGTVKMLGIIDTGIKYRDGIMNPATGFMNDRCVLVLREAQSRLIPNIDSPVFYSVADIDLLTTPRALALKELLRVYGISSEQNPLQVEDSQWNIQTDALFTNLVDFSHWYVIPTSPLHQFWRMSSTPTYNEQAKKYLGYEVALKLGGEHLGIFGNGEYMMKIFGTKDQGEARIKYLHEKQEMQEEWKEVGVVGHAKPFFSWSWFLETDNSQLMDWTLTQGKVKEKGGYCKGAEDGDILSYIDSHLPNKPL